jgi:hypothetical protein
VCWGKARSWATAYARRCSTWPVTVSADVSKPEAAAGAGPAAACPGQPTTAQVVVAFFAGSLSEVAVSFTWPRWAPPVACLA